MLAGLSEWLPKGLYGIPKMDLPSQPSIQVKLPGKPGACNYGLFWLMYGLPWGIVACCFG